MQRKIMNGKDAKKLHRELEKQFGFSGKLDVVFMLQEKKQKVFVFTKDLADTDISGLRIDTMGLYFGAWYKGQFRLTIEGTQLIGPQCTKNVVVLSRKEMQQWMSGETLETGTQPGVEDGAFVILRHGSDFLGCGKHTGKEILNYIPKTRYVHALYD